MKKEKDIWTVECSNITTEEGVFNHLSAVLYYDAESAIEAAKKIADEYAGDDDVMEATVYEGEYQTDTGDVFGEPYDIFCATNKSPVDSAKARMDAGFCKLYIDYYAVDTVIRTENIDYDGKSYLSVSIPSPFSDINGYVVIAEQALDDALTDDSGDYVDKSAEDIDNWIVCYCPRKWFSLPANEFIKLIVKTFS